MSEFRFSYPACAIAGKSQLTVQDIAILRSIALPQGAQCESDIVALLAINNSCREKCPQWADYFNDTITTFVMNGIVPRGRLDETKSGLIQRLFSASGLIRSPEELGLVLHLIATADSAPESLVAFALDQLRLALQTGRGAYAETRKASQGIGVSDLAYVARVLDTARNDDDGRLSPLAASVLEAINAVSLPSFNHPGWNDLMAAIRQLDDAASLPDLAA